MSDQIEGTTPLFRKPKAADLPDVPAVLRGIVPPIGSTWIWEPEKAHARERLVVTKVEWNGEEVWVTARCEDGREYPNSLDRWVEATVLVASPSGTGETRAR